MSPTMTVPLVLAPDGTGWQLELRGDWSLAAMPQIEARLESLPTALRGPLTCDWSHAEAPGIGPAWALLRRLSDAGLPPAELQHTGDPPHFLELLQKLERDQHAAIGDHVPRLTWQSLIGAVGRWSV